MLVIRWLAVAPFAIIALVLGSTLGSLVCSPFGQAAVDTGGAFGGTFAFVFTAGYAAPARKRLVTGIAVSLIIAMLIFAYTYYLMGRAEYDPSGHITRFTLPVAHILAAVCAWFLLRPFMDSSQDAESALQDDTSDSRMHLGDYANLLGCLALLVINLSLGAYCTNYAVYSVFGKYLPTTWAVIGGFFFAEATIPIAVLCFFARLLGADVPFIQ